MLCVCVCVYLCVCVHNMCILVVYMCEQCHLVTCIYAIYTSYGNTHWCLHNHTMSTQYAPSRTQNTPSPHSPQNQAIIDYPESNAVLVRRHGVYVWGSTWIEAKTQSECYDYLFESALRMRQMGVDASVPPAPAALTNGGLVNGGADTSMWGGVVWWVFFGCVVWWVFLGVYVMLL